MNHFFIKSSRLKRSVHNFIRIVEYALVHLISKERKRARARLNEVESDCARHMANITDWYHRLISSTNITG